MVKIIAIVVGLLVVVIGGILVYAATKPDSFAVERRTTIKAPPETIFALINDFQSWSAWSPYEKKDPAMARSYSGPTSGKGAVYEWDGNKEVGKGRMEITDATPPSKIVLKLDFVRPFEAHNIVEFTLAAEGDSTEVTWAMQGASPYFAKVMGVFLDIDNMIGKDFEAGLESLKALAESK